MGDKRPSQTVARLGAAASLPIAPNSNGAIPTRSTKSGHHLSAYKRTHYGGHYPEGGGRGAGGPRHGDDAASICSSKSSKIGKDSGPRDPKTVDPKTMCSPKHGFSRTHDGGYWGKGRPSSAASTRSGGSESSSKRRFPATKRELNVREDELDRIKGFSRKPNGGYWKDREHLDPNPGRPRPHSAQPATRWEPDTPKLWTPRSAYQRKKLGEFFRPEQVEMDDSGQQFSRTGEAPEIFEDKAADPNKPKPGYTRTQYGSYYRDPDGGIQLTPRRTASTSVPPSSGFTRTPMGGFFRGKPAHEADELNLEVSKHFDALPVNPNREADPAAPGPGYTRTNYGGFYIREKQYAE